MYFKQFYLGCLSQASYLIGSEGEGAVVDPQRDVDQYIDEAKAQGLSIKYVIETHLHADFVSGHRELAERSGSEIVFGEKAGATFPHRAVREGDEIRLGKTLLRFIETPGHTPESISVLVIDTEAFRSASQTAHWRHALCRRCRPPGSGARQGLYAADDGWNAVRHPAPETLAASRRDRSLSGTRCWLYVWAQYVEGDFLNNRRAKEV